MSDINSIKNRINSVKSTKKITGAMYLISSAKIQRAKERLSGTRPFFEALKGEVRRIFIQQDDIRSVYFGKKKGKRVRRE
jgi:F-type H+-transporting ATPase subunit gamma